MLHGAEGQPEGLSQSVAGQIPIASMAGQTGGASSRCIDARHGAISGIQHAAIAVGEQSALGMGQ